MSDQSPSKDATTTPAGAEAALASLFENEYFRLKIEEAVRQRTQSELSAWWKRLVATVAVITAVVGAFGIKAYMSLNDAADKADKVSQSVAARSQEVNDLMGRAKDDVSAFRKTTEQVQSGLDENRREVAEFMNGAADRAGEFSMRFGTFEEGFRRDRDNVDRTLGEARSKFLQADEKMREVSQWLVAGQAEQEHIKKEQEDMKKRNAEFLSTTSKDYEDFKTARAQKDEKWMNSVDFEVTRLKDKLLGGGSFVINEKSPTQLNPPLGDGKLNPLVVRVKRVKAKEVLGMTIQDSMGSIVLQPADLLVNSSLRFTSAGYNYTLTLRYITELLLNSDQAGIDLTWEKVGEHQSVRASAQEETAGRR